MPTSRHPRSRWCVALTVALTLAGLLQTGAPRTVAARDPVGANDFTSEIFDYSLEWEDPWEAVDGSYAAAEDETYEALSLTDGNSAIRVELADLGMSVFDVTQAAIQGTISDKENVVDLGGGNTDDVFVYLLEFDAELDTGETVRVRAYIEVSDLDGRTLRDGRPVQVITLLSPVDDLADAADSAQESITRNGGDPFFLSDPADGLAAIDAARAPATPGQPGIDGNVFTSRTLGFAFSWDPDIWEPQDSGNDQYDVLLLTNEAGSSITISGGRTDVDDLQQCLDAESEALQNPDDNAVDFVQVDRGFTLPRTNLGGEWVGWQYHVFWTSDIEYDLITYLECRYLEEAGGMIVVEVTAEIEDWEAEIPFFDAILATLNLGPDAPENDQPESDETPVADDETTGSYEVGIADVFFTWDESVWKASPGEDDASGSEFVFLTAETASMILLVYPDDSGDAGQCVDDGLDSLENDEGAIDIRSARRFEEPEWDAAEETDFVTFTLQFDGGTDLNGVAWFGCAAVDDHMVLVRAAADEENWDDAVPLINDVLAAIDL